MNNEEILSGTNIQMNNNNEIKTKLNVILSKISEIYLLIEDNRENGNVDPHVNSYIKNIETYIHLTNKSIDRG